MLQGKKCAWCESHFTTGNDRKIYCSNACKNKAYRSRHKIPEPEFLRPRVKPQKTAREIFLSGMSNSKNVILADNEELKVVKVKESVKRPHPEFEKYKERINKINSQLAKINTEKDKLLKRFTRIANNNPELTHTLAGAVIGTSTYVVSQKKEEVDYSKAAWFGVLGGAIGLLTSSLTKKTDSQKALELNRINRKIVNLDSKSNQLQIERHQIGIWLKKIPRHHTVIEERTKQVIQKKELNIPSISTIEKMVIANQRNKKAKKPKEVSLSNLQSMRFDTIGLRDEWYRLFGDPQRGFKMLIWGENGHGKSTYALKFAHYLANGFGHVLYNSSEERISQSLQKKLLDFKSDYFTITEGKTFEELKELLKNPKYAIVFIDSVNDMMMKYEDFKALVDTYPTKCFIYIMQVTKDGNFKGDNRFAHLADIKLQVKNHAPILEKSRYK